MIIEPQVCQAGTTSPSPTTTVQPGREQPLQPEPALRCARAPRTLLETRAAPADSPLRDRILVWHSQLQRAHTHVCDAPSCCGIRALRDIIQLGDGSYRPSSPAQRLSAIEAEDLLHSIHYGFRVLHTQRQPATVPSIRVINNYPSPPEHETELWTQTEQEPTEGKVWEVSEPPASIHPSISESKA